MDFLYLTETRQAAYFPLGVEGWLLRSKLPGNAVPFKSPEGPISWAHNAEPRAGSVNTVRAEVCLPQFSVEVLTPGTSESRLMWKQGCCQGHQ